MSTSRIFEDLTNVNDQQRNFQHKDSQCMQFRTIFIKVSRQQGGSGTVNFGRFATVVQHLFC